MMFPPLSHWNGLFQLCNYCHQLWAQELWIVLAAGMHCSLQGCMHLFCNFAFQSDGTGQTRGFFMLHEWTTDAEWVSHHKSTQLVHVEIVEWCNC